MDPEIKQKIDTLSAKVDAVYGSVEKTRKYFLIIVWITVIGFVLPLVGLAFAIPSFLSTYSDMLNTANF